MLERLTWPPKKLRGAIDTALWDIAGKRHGLPVWRLLGACRDKVPAYRTQSGTMGPEGLRKDHFLDFALQVKEEGYLGSKDHCYAGPKFMIELAGELRDAVGPDFHLMHDAVGFYDVKEAIRVGRALEEREFTWFEEPLRDQDFSGYKHVRDALEIPVVAGEYFPHQLHSYAQMVAMGRRRRPQAGDRHGRNHRDAQARPADFRLRSHPARVGARATCGGSPRSTSTAPSRTGPCWRCTPPSRPTPTRRSGTPCRMSGGYVEMPEAPGLGVDLDWDAIEDMTVEVIE